MHQLKGCVIALSFVAVGGYFACGLLAVTGPDMANWFSIAGWVNVFVLAGLVVSIGIVGLVAKLFDD